MPSWARWQSLLSAVGCYRRTEAMSTRQQTAIRQQLADDTRTHGAAAAGQRPAARRNGRTPTPQARLHTLQDELVQASKLALLGQVAAGVAHEINQPVAAIRSYADNAAEFRRQDPETAREPESIASLTGTLSPITQRGAPSRARPARRSAPISLGAALDGCAGCWPRLQGVALHRPAAGQDAQVLADRIRLGLCWSICCRTRWTLWAVSPAAASPWPCATRASGCLSLTTDRA